MSKVYVAVEFQPRGSNDPGKLIGVFSDLAAAEKAADSCFDEASKLAQSYGFDYCYLNKKGATVEITGQVFDVELDRVVNIDI